jgi:hypothetical protein
MATISGSSNALVALALAFACAGPVAAAPAPFEITVANKTAVPVRVDLELNTGHALGHLDLGAGATGRTNVWLRPDVVKVRGNGCAAYGTAYGSAHAYRVHVAMTPAHRCEVHVYPVAS